MQKVTMYCDICKTEIPLNHPKNYLQLSGVSGDGLYGSMNGQSNKISLNEVCSNCSKKFWKLYFALCEEKR